MKHLLAALILFLLIAPAYAQDFEKGKAAWARLDYAAALREWRPLAEQGHANAQFQLALMYGQGQGVAKDFEQAAKWLRKAAEQGLASAQSLLGLLYAEGQGVPKNFAKSAKWYGKAAEQNDADAQFRLGLMYGDGRGVPRDYVKALMWLNLAGEYRAAENREIVSKLMTAEQIAEAQHMAREKGEELTMKRFRSTTGQSRLDAEQIRLDAEKGNAGAQYKLGFLYEEGRGIKQDFVQAHTWYDIAALRGEETAATSRDRIAHKMTPAQIAEAKRLARKIGSSAGVPQAITKHEVEPGASDKRVCAMSTAYGEWGTSKLFQDWVTEAHRRNLSLVDCETLLKAN